MSDEWVFAISMAGIALNVYCMITDWADRRAARR